MEPPPTTALPPLPTFLIIGAQKSATRWLRHNLGLHPEIFTAPQEVKYFNHPKRVDRLGPDWYRRQFTGWAGEPVVGEATPGYLMLRHDPGVVAARIDRGLPEVRLVALLRDPVDRAQSAFIHHRRQGRIHPNARVLEQVRSQDPDDDWLGLVSGGRYAASLAPYLERFDGRVLVLLHDDVRSDPAAVFDRAVRHVGASPTFVPPTLEEVRASNQKGGPPSSSVLSDDERVELFEYFRADIDELERLIGRDLSIWRPGGADQHGAGERGVAESDHTAAPTGPGRRG